MHYLYYQCVQRVKLVSTTYNTSIYTSSGGREHEGGFPRREHLQPEPASEQRETEGTRRLEEFRLSGGGFSGTRSGEVRAGP